MRLGLVVLPVQPWIDAQRTWRGLEDLGIDVAYTYDHIEWGGWKGKPWFGAFPLLAAVAASTSRMRIGTLVSSINLRHPLELAQHVVTIDDLSDGRFDLGIGAGTGGFDAAVHGRTPWSSGERVERFADYVELLDALLTSERTTSSGAHYSVVDAPLHAGCVQQPRVPFTIAADKPRSMQIAARHADRWVANTVYGEVAEKCERLDAACAAAGRDPSSIERVLLVDQPLDEVASIEGALADADALGFSETVFRYPHGGDESRVEDLAGMG